MALALYIPPCIHNPPHRFHPPPADTPLRIQIQGPLECVQKLLPNVAWHPIGPFPQPGGVQLANLVHRKLYGGDHDDEEEDEKGLLEKKAERNHASDNEMPKVRDEYLAWVMDGKIPLDYIDYYGVTFDHCVPPDDPNPEVLAINFIEVDHDGGEFAKAVLPFSINVAEYTGKRVLAVPRCCQIKNGTQDRERINGLVAEREEGVA